MCCNLIYLYFLSFHYDIFKWSQMYNRFLILVLRKNNVLSHIRRTGGRCTIFVECTAYCCDELLFVYSIQSSAVLSFVK